MLYDIDWGAFSLIEFLGSKGNQIGSTFKTALDIGSGDGVHTSIMRDCGLEVFQVDKYSDKAEYKEDFLDCQFENTFDVVFCSHVIEHQRNVGLFLDKIFDSLNDNGLLLISAPKHDAENLIEGHLNCFFTSYFIQHLVHAGFDCSSGKYLSCSGIENAAIVSKAKNYDYTERKGAGYIWTDKHKERCFFPLENQRVTHKEPFFYNCEVISSPSANLINIDVPLKAEKFGVEICSKRWGIKVAL